jgi:hypothetical protein
MIDKIKAWMQEQWLFLIVGIIVFVIAMIALRINMRFWSMDTVGTDTYYSWVEGRRILDGKNPYERVLHGNMRDNQKYATYFPLFYEASALVLKAGYRQYHPWISFFRYIFLACNLATGLALYVMTFSKRTWALALLAVLFWYFNRWTLFASSSVALDFIPILLLVLSLGTFGRYRKLSLLLFSFSLAFKQIGAFIAPLYLIWEYQESRSIKNVIFAGLWIASIPLLSSIPFLFWNAEGFIKSIAFPVTRNAATQFGSDSIDVVARLSGLVARLPILVMLLGVYFVAWQKVAGRYGAAMLVMAIFTGFNPVVFAHYLAWLMPLLPLAAGEWIHQTQMNSLTPQNSA